MARTLRFDASRKRYRVRISDRGDTKVNVPRRLFDAAGVPFDRQTSRGDEIAAAWAEAQRIAKIEHAKLNFAEIYKLYKKSNLKILKPSTTRRNTTLAANLAAYFQDADPSTIDIADMEDYRDMRLKYARVRTVKNECAFARTILTWGYNRRERTGMDDIRLAEPVRLPKETEPWGISLSPEELGRALAVPLDHYQTSVRNILLRTVTTGLRLTALVNLRWEWIDFENRWLRIPAGAGVMKFDKAHEMPLCSWFFDTLPERTRRRGLVDPSPLTGGRKLWPIDSVRTIVEKAEIRYFTAHDLRRTFSTWLGSAGVDKFIVGRLITHGDSDVTGAYILETNRLMEAAVAILDTVYRPRVEEATRQMAGLIVLTRRPSGGRKRNVPENVPEKPPKPVENLRVVTPRKNG